MPQHVVEHFFGELAGERVLLADVVGAQEYASGSQAKLGAVTERNFASGELAALAEGEGEGGVPADFPKGQQDAGMGEQIPFAVEIGGAIGDFIRQGFIGGRSAADRGADVDAGEFQAIIAMLGMGLIGEAGAVKGGEEKIAGAVAGKNAAGAVGTVSAGGQSDDPDAGGGIAEAGDGFAPVFLGRIGAAFFNGDGLTIGAQASAALAGRDLGGQLRQRAGG